MTTFEAATAVEQQSSHEYTAIFPEDWCIGKVPHGGFVTSCFLQVASAHFRSTLSSQNQPHTITLHLDFLRRTQAGIAIFKVCDTKLGRQTSIIHVTLSQPKFSHTKGPFKPSELREEVVGYLTNSNIHAEVGPSFHTGYELSPPVPPVDLARARLNKDKNWARQESMPFLSFRKATQKLDFYFPRRGQAAKSIGDEWVRFSNGERWTNASIGYIADMWPMPAEQLRDATTYDISATRDQSSAAKPAKFWYPTLLLNLDIKKALPEDGVDWLFARVMAKQVKNGRMDIEVIIMDEAKEIVALSHHVCLILGSERNLACRRQETSKI